MTATITATNGAGATSPITVLVPYKTAWGSRNRIHDLVGDGLAVSLVPPRPRAGELIMLYPDEASAYACAELHRERSTFVLTETERPHLGMEYVLDGSGISVELNEKTKTSWLVTVGYQEVEP